MRKRIKIFYPFSALGENLIVNKNTGAVYKVSDKIMDACGGADSGENLPDELKTPADSGKKSINSYLDFAKKLETQDTSPNSFCLIISGNCNLNCEYCYGGYGVKTGNNRNMDPSTARAAVDFLFSQDSNKIEFDLFGGEPLINWGVCAETIKYIKEKEKNSGKKVKIALTTNGYLFDEEKQNFLINYGVNLVLSLDGGKTCHNELRKSLAGEDTFDRVYKNIKKYLSKKNDNYYVRGTYTKKNLDFYESFKFYMDNGIKYFSLEPVVRADSGLSIKKEDLEIIDKEYQKCAEILSEANKKEEKFHFYHFNMNIYKPPCVEKKLRGCAAGVKYFAVDYNGDIYPCHQFVGTPEFKMGHIRDGPAAFGVEDRPYLKISNQFKKNHIFNKPKCADCWVKVYCSGGCAAANYFANRDILAPEDISCEIMKIRAKYALAYNAKKETR